MQELIVSMMKFSAAMTLFGMQQLQNAVGAATDSQAAIKNFRESLDAMSDAIAKQMDDSKKATLDSMAKVQSDLVDRTFDAMNLQAFDPKEMMETTSDIMKKTTDSLNDIVRRATPKASGAGEPRSAAEVMGA